MNIKKINNIKEIQTNEVTIYNGEYVVWNGTYDVYSTLSWGGDYENHYIPQIKTFPLTEDGLKSAIDRVNKNKFYRFWKAVFGYKLQTAFLQAAGEIKRRRAEKLNREMYEKRLKYYMENGDDL